MSAGLRNFLKKYNLHCVISQHIYQGSGSFKFDCNIIKISHHAECQVINITLVNEQKHYYRVA
jgi:hypothetical protein